jgi:hypothetical protein
MTIFAVRIREASNYNHHVYLIEAQNKHQAKNLAEAKWYEQHPDTAISEGETAVWEIEQDYATNPSVRS